MIIEIAPHSGREKSVCVWWISVRCAVTYTSFFLYDHVGSIENNLSIRKLIRISMNSGKRLATRKKRTLWNIWPTIRSFHEKLGTNSRRNENIQRNSRTKNVQKLIVLVEKHFKSNRRSPVTTGGQKKLNEGCYFVGSCHLFTLTLSSLLRCPAAALGDRMV